MRKKEKKIVIIILKTNTIETIATERIKYIGRLKSDSINTKNCCLSYLDKSRDIISLNPRCNLQPFVEYSSSLFIRAV
jgi:hypothetical protein